MTAEVEPVLEERLRFEAELPEERRHVTVVAALVQEKMGDELAAGVPDTVAVDINLVSFAEVGFGPCIEMGLEDVACPAPVGVDLGPGQEVIGARSGIGRLWRSTIAGTQRS